MYGDVTKLRMYVYIFWVVGRGGEVVKSWDSINARKTCVGSCRFKSFGAVLPPNSSNSDLINFWKASLSSQPDSTCTCTEYIQYDTTPNDLNWLGRRQLRPALGEDNLQSFDSS